ncbi:LLM class flavin-dependent oxidoreductase [Virgibacillus sp. MG-45]|uniref:LLM class flavin-dependent oxidoreductase n=1 Tax=Virgibacillus sp. MG-45 TaxID=3102791 RepID=UPI002EDB9796
MNSLISSNAKRWKEIPLSILDLVPVLEGSDARTSFQNSVDLAQHAENWGYNRFWVAEHHNNPGIASSATSVVIGHIAGATNTIRVGSGGVMLPNHAALIIAEQFGTLDSLYPGRIDLGLGRAPGTDQLTAYALRRTLNQKAEDFPLQVEELEAYFNGSSRIRAVPGEGASIPIWLLGSSGFSAQLAAYKGLPFSFASHFAPDNTLTAIQLYRDNFQPSDVLKEPYVMLGVSVIAADTDEEAERIASSQKQALLSLRSGMPTKLQPPVDNFESLQGFGMNAGSEITASIIGSPTTTREKLEELILKTGANELIITGQIYSHEARLHSYEIIANMMG